MPINDLAELLRSRNATLQEHLRAIHTALNQTTRGSYEQCRCALSALQELCGLLEQETCQNFSLEERVLFPLAKARWPERWTLFSGLQEEHEIILQRLKEFHTELSYFNTSGESRKVQPLGEELISLLRRHGSREADELFPLLQMCTGERQSGEENATEVVAQRSMGPPLV